MPIRFIIKLNVLSSDDVRQESNWKGRMETTRRVEGERVKLSWFKSIAEGFNGWINKWKEVYQTKTREKNSNDEIAQKRESSPLRNFGMSWVEKISNPISLDCLPPTLRTWNQNIFYWSSVYCEEGVGGSRSMLAVNKLKVQHNVSSAKYHSSVDIERECEDFVNISWFYRQILEIDSVDSRPKR